MFRALKTRLKFFIRKDDGLVSVEFVLLFPILMFGFMATASYFDAFRQDSANLKAAYTISDLISRETNAINDTYIDSMHSLYSTLTRQDSTTAALRITSVRWDEGDNSYFVDWSVQRGDSLASWSDGTISAAAERLPNMVDNERIILVETKNVIRPLFDVKTPAEEQAQEWQDAIDEQQSNGIAAEDVEKPTGTMWGGHLMLFLEGINEITLSHFVFTRPRFAPQVVYEAGYNGSAVHDDGGELID